MLSTMRKLIQKIMKYMASMLNTTTSESAMAFFSLTTIEAGNVCLIALMTSTIYLMLSGKTVDYIGISVLIGALSTFIGVGYAGKHYSGKYETPNANNPPAAGSSQV